ncbi:MAG: PEP-CTERM sorting domain-containing protein [Thermoguttaceae bacterium]|nr:PEP-CTERM sorting domain-containing protein [Thermoguttaceae bacterium]MDW8038551.1 PEP-CTERM sorting domain-containing protein [Thermoguttaceae bacterium]
MKRLFLLAMGSIVVGFAWLGQAQGAIMQVSYTAPTVDGADIAQLVGGQDLGGNQGHIWGNRPVQGQTFTTGSYYAGYTLFAVTLQNLSTTSSGSTFTIRVGEVNGTNFTPIRTETASPVSYNPGAYITYVFDVPIKLAPNKVYGFDVGASGSGYITSNTTNNMAYPDGVAYSSGANGVGGTTLTLHNGIPPNVSGDRVFHLDMIEGWPPLSSGRISVNFVGGGPNDYGTYQVTGVAGAVPLPNWNNIMGPAWNNPDVVNVTLKDSTGMNTTARITVDVPNTWYSGADTSTQDGLLLKGYLDNAAASGSLIRVVGLDEAFANPFGYKVYVYYDTDSGGAFEIRVTDSLGNTDVKWAYEAQGSNYTPSLGLVESTARTQDEAWAAIQMGRTSNYVVLGDFFGPNFNVYLTNGNTPLDDRARIAGLQIIANPVPEPSTGFLGILACGVVGLLAWRRRNQQAIGDNKPLISRIL